MKSTTFACGYVLSFLSKGILRGERYGVCTQIEFRIYRKSKIHARTKISFTHWMRFFSYAFVRLSAARKVGKTLRNLVVTSRIGCVSFLSSGNGIPSENCIAWVMAKLSPKAFQKCFVNWAQSITDLTDGEVVNIDGKTLRRSYDRRNNRFAIHMVSA
uniref:Transposase n=1 Tax=Candidatus Kentrum sp. UNK TaxID=2126344 RepID=A0A451B5P7_9GAMM|nr:MAG: hypothetical protein BECKUNK1418G_GA0071005_12411 [Candidatus Kentron sp. UNK]VFK73614.1 MAG: hypothetical protein BECKUNK1418H_GA0071006_12311 [Candidatus Kentron sp. UNK]